jgi:hypothetical protein
MKWLRFEKEDISQFLFLRKDRKIESEVPSFDFPMQRMKRTL